MGEQLLVDALGGAAQGELAQCGEIAGREIMRQRALGLLRDVDLAFLEALDEIVGRQIDQLDGVGAVEDRVRDSLADAHAGDLRHHVVEALDVLDVDRGVDVDAVGEQLFHVEVALGMAAARRVGMGELVDQHEMRPPGDDRVEIHFFEGAAAVVDPPARDDFEPGEQRLGLRAAVGLDHADHHVAAVLALGARLFQHLVGLAHARRRADEDFQLAGGVLLALRLGEQGFGRGSLI